MRVGDVVVCINNRDTEKGCLFVGDVYTIVNTEGSSDGEIDFVEVIPKKGGMRNRYLSYRFKLKVLYTKEDLL